MRSTNSHGVIMLLACLIGLLQAEAQCAPYSEDGVVQDSAKNVDPRAVALLEQVNMTFKSMQSFSTEFEDGNMDKHGHISLSIRGQLAFRRPDHLAVVTGSPGTGLSEPNKMLTDGTHSYAVFSRTPLAYIPLRDLPPTVSPFVKLWRSSDRQGVGWLSDVLMGKGIREHNGGWELKSLSYKQEKFVKGAPVETVTALWEQTGYNSKDGESYTYTIGAQDHLLYQASRNYADNSKYVTRYFHLQPDAVLPDRLFALPADILHLPLAHVVTVKSDTVTLDKGSLDGFAVGDVLNVYVSEKVMVQNAQVMVAKTEAHSCTTEILWNTAGIFPGEVCIVVDHTAVSKRAKKKGDDSFWLWPPSSH